MSLWMASFNGQSGRFERGCVVLTAVEVITERITCVFVKKISDVYEKAKIKRLLRNVMLKWS